MPFPNKVLNFVFQYFTTICCITIISMVFTIYIFILFFMFASTYFPLVMASWSRDNWTLLERRKFSFQLAKCKCHSSLSNVLILCHLDFFWDVPQPQSHSLLRDSCYVLFWLLQPLPYWCYLWFFVGCNMDFCWSFEKRPNCRPHTITCNDSIRLRFFIWVISSLNPHMSELSDSYDPNRNPTRHVELYCVT